MNKDKNVHENILGTIGTTPMIKLNKIVEDFSCDVYAKVEYFNPGHSVKDRMALQMVEDAEAEGKLKPGGTIIECTSGNTGIALAFIARERGYRCILTMPETMSVERRMMLLALGAEVVLTPKEKAVSGAIAKAEEIRDEINRKGEEEAIILQQFKNPSNPKIHRETTGPEIWEDTDGTVDILLRYVVQL